MRHYNCRHCGEPFIPHFGKPGFIDECGECLLAKAAPAAASELQQLLEYIAAHPITIDVTGQPVRWKTANKLRQKLRVKGYADDIIEELVAAYLSVYVDI